MLRQEWKDDWKSNPNQYLNTVLYHIKFEDGTTAANSGNIIAENMWRMCNNEGYHEYALHLIVDIQFCKNTVKDGFIYNRNGTRVLRKITRGVDLLCAIKSGQNEDGSDQIMKTWHSLKELKESYPILVAEFAVARGVDKMPAFAW